MLPLPASAPPDDLAVNASARDCVCVLGCRVDLVDMDEAVRRIGGLIAARKFAQVVTFGSEMAMLARRDPAYREVINSAALVVPDTVGVVVAARMLGRRIRDRVAGIELVERVAELCAQTGASVFLLGGHPGVAERAAEALVTRHTRLRIAGTRDGYFNIPEEGAVTTAVRSSGASVVLAGLGFPRQEMWVREHTAQLGDAVFIGVGGTFDVLSGRLSRAPTPVRTLGLEWLYRLVREPRRVARQLVLPQFALLVTAQAVRQSLRRT